MSLDSETVLRLSFFFGILTFVAIWEWAAPRRALSFKRLERWPSNLALVFLNSFLLRVVFPVTAMGFAGYAGKQNWGLFNTLELHWLVKLLGSLLLLDLLIYAQHVVFHKVPFLWRFHRMHHADLDFDVTTGSRFHPVEILLSFAIKLGAIRLLGVSADAVIAFEVLLNGMAMFNHGNIYIPEKIDCWLRSVIVTPDMHRIHHSTVVGETNSNYGFNLPWWDRVFKTYNAEPERGQVGLEIGLEEFREPKDLRLDRLLGIPFREGE